MSSNILEEDQIREYIKKEFLKCGTDPEYFMRRYCMVQHPQEGKLPFSLYDFQADILQEFLAHRYTVVLKGRQLGLSTLVAGYALWLMTFFSDKNILVIATKQEVAKNLITKVRVMYDELPSWLREPASELNKLSIRFVNRSQIKAISSSEDAGRSDSLSLLVLDEAAHIVKIKDIWTAASSTLATGGDCIALSTPNGLGNWFHDIYSKAVTQENEWYPIKLKWDVHPDRDQDWRDAEDTRLGITMAQQENDCSFITSGNSVIDKVILKAYEEHTDKNGNLDMIIDPIAKMDLPGLLWYWKQPDYSTSYILCADVARGDADDYSTFHVLDTETVEQVAEFRGKISPKEFGNLCVNEAVKWNNALLIIDNTNIGFAAIQQIIDREYPNLFYMSKDLKYVDVHHQISNKVFREEEKMIPGFSITTATRPLLIQKLIDYFEDASVIIHSRRLLDELYVFIYLNYKAQAMSGKNDDLVMALAIGLWIRDTALRLKAEGKELQKHVLNTLFDSPAVMTNKDISNDSWQWQVHGQLEELTWLLD